MQTPTLAEVKKTPPQVRIFKKGEEPDDIMYWLSRPPIERIRALEEIRKQYNDWKYGAGLEFQRVYSIVTRSSKQATGRRKDLADVEELEKQKRKKK